MITNFVIRFSFVHCNARQGGPTSHESKPGAGAVSAHAVQAVDSRTFAA